VLLVDCDLRHPSIHTALGLEREPGLTNLLAEGAPVEVLVHSPCLGSSGTALKNLHVLCAGAKAPTPAELLGGEAMTRFMETAQEHYDMVIYDSCPVSFVADAAVLASNSDGVLMVLRASQTRRHAVERAQKQLEALRAKLIGVVLNDVPARVLGSYQYGYYYGYHYYYDAAESGADPAA